MALYVFDARAVAQPNRGVSTLKVVAQLRIEVSFVEAAKHEWRHAVSVLLRGIRALAEFLLDRGHFLAGVLMEILAASCSWNPVLRLGEDDEDG